MGSWPIGRKSALLVDVTAQHDAWVFGSALPFQEWVTFMHEGHVTDGKISLYNVSNSGVKRDSAWILELDPLFPPMFSRTPKTSDCSFIHDVCSGMGGFSTAAGFLGMSTVSALDFNGLARDAFCLNHQCQFVCADVREVSSVFELHLAQSARDCQPMLAAGFPCQPLSTQGSQLRNADPRSKTLPAVLRAAYWLQSAGLLLECVAEAFHDPHTQSAIHEFAAVANFSVFQKVYHLHQVWPSRRTRWFAVLFPKEFDFPGLLDLPRISPAPVVGDLMPSHPWPIWSMTDELQLQWSDVEQSAFSNPAFGSTDREIKLDQPLPTALHSWGSALTQCPCGCRDTGFSPSTLTAKGLRGIKVFSALWPHLPRHIHPKELQLLLGFPPMQEVLSDCKSQLVMLGNSVSPIQVVWILSQIASHLNLVPACEDVTEVLSAFMRLLIQQRDVAWPNTRLGFDRCTLDFPEGSVEVSFALGQTVGQLIQAELALQQSPQKLALKCAGFELPAWAFLQSRRYEVSVSQVPVEVPSCAPLFVEFLGHRQMVWVPSGVSYQVCLNWLGLESFLCLLSETGTHLNPQDFVCPWTTVIVQSDPDVVAMDLSLMTIGFGIDPHLRFSTSWQSMGMFQLDQLVKSNALVSWANHGFGDLTIWLPSFAEAVVELWPSSIEAHLQEWTAAINRTFFVVSYESWGWNLAKICLDSDSVSVTYFEPSVRTSLVVAHVAFRLFRESGRQHFTEDIIVDTHRYGEVGSLGRVFALLDLALGIPSEVVESLVSVRPELSTVQPSGPTVSPTLPWTFHDAQLPVGGNIDHIAPKVPRGLSAKFLLSLARAIAANKKEEVALQTKVVLINPDLPTQEHGICQRFTVYVVPECPCSFSATDIGLLCSAPLRIHIFMWCSLTVWPRLQLPIWDLWYKSSSTNGELRLQAFDRFGLFFKQATIRVAQ